MTGDDPSDDRCVTGVDHIGIRVPDIEEAVEFFVNGLGAEKIAEGLAADGVSPVVFVRLGSTDIELFAVPGASFAALDHLALRAGGDAAAALAAMRDRGVRPGGEAVRGSRGEQLVPLDAATTLGLRTMLHEAHDGQHRAPGAHAACNDTIDLT